MDKDNHDFCIRDIRKWTFSIEKRWVRKEDCRVLQSNKWHRDTKCGFTVCYVLPVRGDRQMHEIKVEKAVPKESVITQE